MSPIPLMNSSWHDTKYYTLYIKRYIGKYVIWFGQFLVFFFTCALYTMVLIYEYILYQL